MINGVSMSLLRWSMGRCCYLLVLIGHHFGPLCVGRQVDHMVAGVQRAFVVNEVIANPIVHA